MFKYDIQSDLKIKEMVIFKNFRSLRSVGARIIGNAGKRLHFSLDPDLRRRVILFEQHSSPSPSPQFVCLLRHKCHKSLSRIIHITVFPVTTFT